MKFELQTLTNYDDDSIINEIRRVAELIPDRKLTTTRFDSISKVHSSTVKKRFGTWAKALEASGLTTRLSHHAKRLEKGKSLTKEELVLLAKKLAKENNVESLTMKEFSVLTGIGQRAILSRVDKWGEIISSAGLKPVPHGRRYNDSDCYENILNLWEYYGRQPKYGELKQTPSTVGPKAYITRWGTWRNALAAFINYVQEPTEQPLIDVTYTSGITTETPQSDIPPARSRHIPLKIRFNVLERDNFRCVKCGRSPANSINIRLHIDHILAWSKGGSNDPINLQTLCSECNFGKGDQSELSDNEASPP